MAPLVRPASLPPTTSIPTRVPTVILLHPGYGTDNILFTLPAVDGTTTRPGLHHRTILTACAIIADNAFGRVYITHDRGGRERVEVPIDDLLEPGEYWLQLSGYETSQGDELAPLSARLRDGPEDVGAAALASMPPPDSTSATSTRDSPAPAISDANQARISPSGSRRKRPNKRIAYPVVPSFGEWQFPHDHIPSEWKQTSLAPPSASSYTGSTCRCWITGYQMGINECHVVPNNQELWWFNNRMRRYTKAAGVSRDEANIALLRADVHAALDGHKFAIIPKPLAPSASPNPPQQDSSRSGGNSDETPFAYATHILETDDEAREFCDLYQNVALAQEGVNKLSPEFLFARFAWAIFAHLQTFLNSPTRRHLAVIVRDEADISFTALKLMNGSELTKFLTARGVTRSGSKARKRSSSQMTEDMEDADSTDDAYKERRQRRRYSLGSANNLDELSVDLDPETCRINANTKWYQEVGRFSRGDLEQERIDRNTLWYDEVGQYSRGNLEQERIDRITRWYDEARRCFADDSDLAYGYDPARGRPRRRGQEEFGSSPPGSDGIPNLSRSFTTHGSNRSSILADMSGGEKSETDQGADVGSAAPGQKTFEAADVAQSGHSHIHQIDGDVLHP